jgi:hypothetical protein
MKIMLILSCDDWRDDEERKEKKNKLRLMELGIGREKISKLSMWIKADLKERHTQKQ